MKRKLLLFGRAEIKRLLFLLIALISLGIAQNAMSQSTNIALNGTGTVWASLANDTSNANPVASAFVNDGDTVSKLLSEPASSYFQAIGVMWATSKLDIDTILFYNGKWFSGNGDGTFDTAVRVQSTVDGLIWTDIVGWTCAPAYPVSGLSAAGGQVFTFTGPAISNVKGIRVLGQVHIVNTAASSWAVAYREVKVLSTPCSGTDAWTNTSFANQTGVFVAEYDFTPLSSDIVGLMGLSDSIVAPNTFSKLACILSFNADTTITARNATTYSAVTRFKYQGGVTYHIKMVVNIAYKVYDVTIKESGGSIETILAAQYGFRAQALKLNNYVTETSTCHYTISNFTVTVPTDTQKPTTPTALVSSNISETGFTLSWAASNDNVGVAMYIIYKGTDFYSAVTGTSVDVTGLGCSGSFDMIVIAGDAAGNWSDLSDPLTVGTATCTGVSNIAVNGTGYLWPVLTNAFDNSSITAEPMVNDGLKDGQGSYTNSFLLAERQAADGVGYQAIGVTFANVRTELIDSILFYNGAYYSWGDGAFNDSVQIQSSTDGITWKIIPNWTISPAYIDFGETLCTDKTYKFTGPTIHDVMGLRVAGRERTSESAYSWAVSGREFEVYGTPNVLAPKFAVNTINVYPNPASDKVNIQVAESSTVSIFNVQGKLLVSKTIQQGTTTLPISLESGLYIIRVHGQSNSVYTGKLMVQ